MSPSPSTPSIKTFDIFNLDVDYDDNDAVQDISGTSFADDVTAVSGRTGDPSPGRHGHHSRSPLPSPARSGRSVASSARGSVASAYELMDDQLRSGTMHSRSGGGGSGRERKQYAMPDADVQLSLDVAAGMAYLHSSMSGPQPGSPASRGRSSARGSGIRCVC